mmetsp:Transcript_112924/g.243264  ORF Transcript_112924/g.243264 Transcript_112924/m.243264 type:complete len:172 (+) Transcript_112924:2-517(+)
MGVVGVSNGWTPSKTASQPTKLTAPGTTADKLYTVVMTDPDAPSRKEPLFREFVHWVVHNVPGGGNMAEGGDVAVAYLGPGPPCNSGPHRYVFNIYEQEGKVETEPAVKALGDRGGKKTHAFMVDAGLKGPVAAGAYESEWEEFVDGVHTAIGFLPPPQYRSPKQKADNPE